MSNEEYSPSHVRLIYSRYRKYLARYMMRQTEANNRILDHCKRRWDGVPDAAVSYSDLVSTRAETP